MFKVGKAVGTTDPTKKFYWLFKTDLKVVAEVYLVLFCSILRKITLEQGSSLMFFLFTKGMAYFSKTESLMFHNVYNQSHYVVFLPCFVPRNVLWSRSCCSVRVCMSACMSACLSVNKVTPNSFKVF